MKRFSFHFRDGFSKVSRPVASALGRFPALFVLGLVAAVAVALSSSTLAADIDFESRMECLALACSLGMFVSVIGQLLLEMARRGRKAQLLFQVAAALLSVLAFFPLVSLLCEPYRFLTVCGLDCALAAGILFVLSRLQGTERAAANSVVAFSLAWIFALCVLTGFFVIYYTFDELILELYGDTREVVLGLLYGISFFVVWPGIYVAYAARKREEISIPAAYKVVVMKVLFPLSFALLAVLYAYFFKRLFLRSMPVGTLNRFISVASAAYLFLYFASLPFDGRLLGFFRKYGALFIAPLLVVQIVTFIGRVSEYGYTWTKAAGLYYIVFSVTAIALSVFRRGKYADVSFLVLAAAFLLGSAGPFNIEELTNVSQRARIERIYRAHGLLKDGVPVAEGAKEAFSQDEMKTVYDAYQYFNRKNKRLPEWARADGKEFEGVFGFTRKMAYGDQKYLVSFRLSSEDAALDVSGYSRIRRFERRKYGITGEVAVAFEIDGEPFDISRVVRPLMKEKDDGDAVDSTEPLVVPLSGGRFLLLTYIYIEEHRGGERDADGRYGISGYLCW